MDNIIVNVRDFSVTPGSRYRVEGTKAHSGEEFREELLEPSFKKAIESAQRLIVNLDGTNGYSTSWLEEVFGGLARKYTNKTVLDKIDFVSDEEPYLIEDIKKYMKDTLK